MEIGPKILKAIRRKGITQKKLADFLGVSSPSVARWITNESYPMVDKFIKMVEYLDMVEDFFPEYKKVGDDDEVVSKGEIDKLKQEIRVDVKDRIDAIYDLLKKPED